jgi:hypothetical protein
MILLSFEIKGFLYFKVFVFWVKIKNPLITMGYNIMNRTIENQFVSLNDQVFL